ncbi:MFS transporter [Xenorhabdus khoisanae]|uniref:glycoside-pentoside-hexuronide (GPH):cation symporter n=1 Tax=Xenorhabdus khoisanae TaxID=880157 RepID=UPI0023590F4D|nr:MFS transporter [Xenorhabdus khoisanae]MDC9614814.1 MFS transporter [Xenorhabdus khoisanae]
MKEKISILEKIGYGFGDAGCNIVGGAVFLFLNFYYTDIYGLNAGTVAAIWLGVRVIEAISDPFIGYIADRTQTRWGKFRPYILFFAFPYALFSVLMFTVPDLDYTGKAIYAFFTYLMMSVTYSFINIPYCSLGSVISDNNRERVACQSFRFMGVGVATLVLTLTLLPLVNLFGHGNKAKGYHDAIILLTSVGLIMFVLCFSLVRERVRPVVPTRDSIVKDYCDIIKNDQWPRLLLVTFINVLPGFTRMASVMYFLTWVIHASEIFTTIFLSVGVIGMTLGSALAKPLSDRFCKLKIFYWVSLLMTILSLLIYFIPVDMHYLILFGYFILNVIHQIAQPINWSIMADVDDYGEYKFGKRLTGINFSCNFLALKLGLALSGALVSGVLALVGYDANQSLQNDHVQLSIVILFTVIPALGYFLTALSVKLLKVDRHMMKEISYGLTKRRVNSTKLTNYLEQQHNIIPQKSQE